LSNKNYFKNQIIENKNWDIYELEGY
jgi:hypothetical protein